MTKIKAEVKVVVTKDGPYMVSGSVPLAKQTIVSDAAGDSQDWRAGEALPAQASYALCRCGHSKNKPYCDGSHKKTRAEAAGEVYEYDENGNARLVAKH